jgi:ubiquinone/menaquinone biosynthesis C-methylase UbiE
MAKSYKMSAQGKDVVEITNTYDEDQATLYFEKHKHGFWHRMSNWYEQQMAARALAMAGNPKSVLDLPCGAGRFWELLARVPDRQLMAADYSEDMIKTALNFQSPRITRRFRIFQTSAFDIRLPDATVDCIFCMRLLHHIAGEEARAKMFREFHRVSRGTVCVSLWVDGNLQALRLRRSQRRRRNRPSYTRFLINRSQIEREFHQSGFEILGHVDLLPGLSMWRTYVLERR